jgi:hypothetical protein
MPCISPNHTSDHIDLSEHIATEVVNNDAFHIVRFMKKGTGFEGFFFILEKAWGRLLITGDFHEASYGFGSIKFLQDLRRISVDALFRNCRSSEVGREFTAFDFDLIRNHLIQHLDEINLYDAENAEDQHLIVPMTGTELWGLLEIDYLGDAPGAFEWKHHVLTLGGFIHKFMSAESAQAFRESLFTGLAGTKKIAPPEFPDSDTFNDLYYHWGLCIHWECHLHFRALQAMLQQLTEQ